MTRSQFNNLNRKQKLLAIQTKGIEVAKDFTRYGAIKLMTCYSLDGFFVEVVLHVANQEIEEVVAFVDGERLNRYTDKGMRDVLNEAPLFFSMLEFIADTLRINFKDFKYNKQLTLQLVKAINTLDANLLEGLFDEDIVYEEQKPFFAIRGNGHIKNYFYVLFKKLKTKNRQYFASLGYYKNDKDKPCIIICTSNKNKKTALVMVNTVNNKINRIYYCTKQSYLELGYVKMN
ncbi:hypothetical protein [Gelatiniphilus marinus]|uniref:Uncharacterized protein n=1 Tax=Gelatiniphilus marinus TaxID=1759464 RepID=A0ABW5JU79_9FLAO